MLHMPIHPRPTVGSISITIIKSHQTQFLLIWLQWPAGYHAWNEASTRWTIRHPAAPWGPVAATAYPAPSSSSTGWSWVQMSIQRCLIFTSMRTQQLFRGCGAEMGWWEMYVLAQYCDYPLALGNRLFPFIVISSYSLDWTQTSQ